MKYSPYAVGDGEVYNAVRALDFIMQNSSYVQHLVCSTSKNTSVPSIKAILWN